MFCSKCGQQNGEADKYCRDCGKSLKGNNNRKSTWHIVLYTVLVMGLFGVGGFGFQYLQSGDVIQSDSESASADETTQIEKVPAEPEEVVEKESEQQPADEGTVSKTEPPKDNEVKLEPKKKEKTAVIKETQQKVYTILTESGQGSGFLYTTNGEVVTNAHVVAGYTDVMVRNINGQEQPGQVIGISDIHDIALIQVDAFQGIEPLPVEKEKTEVGTEVIALGSPNGFENTASIGYLTGVDRDLTHDFVYEDVYQIDAQIAPGSSGGPLIDAESGKVIGINSLLYNDGNAIGFSIPMFSANESLSGWANQPMSAREVAALFGVYDDYEDYSYEEEDYNYEYDSEGSLYFDEYSLSEFLSDYRYYYEMALDNEDFYYIEDMLVYDTPIYYGISDYIDGISGQGMIFDFTDLTILDIEIFDDYALVYTYEAFDFMNAAGEWSLEERTKTYTIVMDDYGYYYVAAIVKT